MTEKWNKIRKPTDLNACDNYVYNYEGDISMQ